MAAIPVLDLQALTEISDDALVQERLARRVQVGLVAQGGEQSFQAFAERVLAEIGEPGARASLVHDVVGDSHCASVGGGEGLGLRCLKCVSHHIR